MTSDQGGKPREAADPTDDCILAVSGLTVSYGDRVALDDVTFSVSCGARMAVVGPNGAGKTTLFRVIAGLLPASSGAVTVHGHPPGEGVCVAYVPQRNDIDWRFPVSVADVVMMARVGRIGLLRRAGAIDRARVADALAAMRLTELARRQIGRLSGGQQQRMFIARALAQEAELVLMDEPMTGLDALSRDDILSALDSLRDMGVSVMAATHDLELAAEVFDGALLLNHRVIGHGRPAALFTEANLLEAYGGRVRFLDPGHGHDDDHDHDHELARAPGHRESRHG